MYVHFVGARKVSKILHKLEDTRQMPMLEDSFIASSFRLVILLANKNLD